VTTVSLTKYLSPVLLLKRKLIHLLPAILICLLFITTQFLNTEYSLRAILLSSVISFIMLGQKVITKSSLQLPQNITKLTFLYLVTSLISLFLSKTPNIGLSEITQDFSYLFIFLILISYTKSKLDISNILITLAKANIIIQSVLVIVQIFVLNQTRAYGSFMSFFDDKLVYPNALGLSLILSIFLIQDTNKNHKWIISCLGIFSLLFTYSRGAILSAILGATVYILIITVQKKYKQIPKVISTIVLASLTFLISSTFLTTNSVNLQEKFTFQGTEQITSLMERKQFLFLSPQLGLDHILNGYGPNSFQYIFPTIQEIPLSNSQHPHNVLIKIFIERGLISLVIFFAIILLTIHLVFKDKIHFKQTGLITGLFAVSLHSLIDYNFNLPLNSLFLVLTLSAIWQQKKEKQTQTIKITSLAISTATITTILFLSHFTYRYPHLSPLKLNQINYKDSLIQASNQQESAESKIQLVIKHTIKNPYDSFGLSNLGYLYKDSNQEELAIKAFQNSIKINPKNFWYPYNQLTSLFKSNKSNLSDQKIEDYILLLQEYKIAADQNLHFTAQSDNIQQAIKTAQNLTFITDKKDELFELNKILESLRSSQERFSSN
jgi:hypothetical protein